MIHNVHKSSPPADPNPAYSAMLLLSEEGSAAEALAGPRTEQQATENDTLKLLTSLLQVHSTAPVVLFCDCVIEAVADAAIGEGAFAVGEKSKLGLEDAETPIKLRLEVRVFNCDFVMEREEVLVMLAERL